MGLLPWGGEHALQVDLLMAVGAGLLLTHDAPGHWRDIVGTNLFIKKSLFSPSADAELVELVPAGQPEGVLQHPVLIRSHQQLVRAHWGAVRKIHRNK